MELKVLWTDIATELLEQIFDFYKYQTNTKTAQKIISKIIERTDQLEQQPLSGQKEELLNSRKHEYRYILEGNYKIIYWIEDQYIKIALVFDCRQNPVKLNLV